MTTGPGAQREGEGNGGDGIREDSVNDFNYLEALEIRHATLTAERDEAAEAIKGVEQHALEAKTQELQQLEADLAQIWTLRKGAKGRSPRA
jgi:hypothetical protein